MEALNYAEIASKLWMLLDNIDTLDDACRADDAAFRKHTRAAQRKRFAVLSGAQFDALRSTLQQQEAQGMEGYDGVTTHPEFGAAVEIDRDNDGELLIDWHPKKGRTLSMTLRADGRLSYAFIWDDEKAHGTAQMPKQENP